MFQSPFYDPEKTYFDNFEYGPFNGFTDGVVFPVASEPRFTFLGQRIQYPFGIPAGPLLNSKYIQSAFEKGFDVNVYKTVRSAEYPCHPFPNVLSVHVDGALTLEKARVPLVADTHYADPISITNSFGVPSRPRDLWQVDAQKAITAGKNGQLMIMSFMGTVKEGQTSDEFVADYVEAAHAAYETGARALEVNLSCPNIGNEGLVCYNAEMTEKVVRGIRAVIGETPLILKVGYYTDDASIQTLMRLAAEYADAVSAINTVQATIIDAHGAQALPGPQRVKSGVCGASIKWAGLDMTKRLAHARATLGTKTEIIGVGGVTTPQDFKEYRDAGADVVMSATGAMWNPYLADEIKKAFPDA